MENDFYLSPLIDWVYDIVLRKFSQFEKVKKY